MAKVYVAKCVVKKDKKVYQKGAIIDNLSAEEIERGLDEHWLEQVGTDEAPAAVEVRKDKNDKKNKKNEKPGSKPADDKDAAKAERDQLLEKALDLGILDKITDEMTVEEIQKLVTEAQPEVQTQEQAQ